MGPGHAAQLVAVGVDGREASTEAARYAAAIAEDRGWDLMVVHSYQLATSGPAPPETDPRSSGRAAEAVVDEVLSLLRLGSRTRVHRVVTPSAAADTLVQVSRYVSLLVLGQHRFDLADELLAGQVGPAVTVGARCPVVVVPPGWSLATSADRPVVVALDGERPSEAALRSAVEEARLRGTRVLALLGVLGEGSDAVLAEERAALGAVLAEVELDHPDVEVRTLRVHGDPRSGILGDAVAAAQVVVGRPRPDGQDGSWARLAAGAVMAESGCPVLITPSEDPEEEARARGAAQAYIGRGEPRPLPGETQTGPRETTNDPQAPAPTAVSLAAGPTASPPADVDDDEEEAMGLEPVAGRAALAGVVAPILFLGTLLVDGAVRPGYDPFSMLVSWLTLGEHGWIERVNFVVSGVLVLIFAFAVARVFRGGHGARSAPVVVNVLGVCLVLSGFVGTRVPGTAGEGPIQRSIHELLGVAVLVCLPILCFVLAWRLRGVRPAVRLGRASAVVGGVLVLLIVALEGSRPSTSALWAWRGLVERSVLVLFMAWLLVFAATLLRGRPAPAGLSPDAELATGVPSTQSLPVLSS